MNADLEKSSSSQSPVPHHSAEQLKTQPQDPPKQRHSITANNTLPAGGEWFSKFMLDYAPSYVLQNKGAVARDHLGTSFLTWHI